VNPYPEVRYSGTVQCRSVYHFARPDLWIRIRHWHKIHSKLLTVIIWQIAGYFCGKFHHISITYHFTLIIKVTGRSQWPRGLRRRPSASRLLRLRVWIPPGAWMSFSCDCCVLWIRCLCVGLITCPEESYRMWSWSLDYKRPWPTCRNVENKRKYSEVWKSVLRLFVRIWINYRCSEM
jgi:hypothetical protein